MEAPAVGSEYRYSITPTFSVMSRQRDCVRHKKKFIKTSNVWILFLFLDRISPTMSFFYIFLQISDGLRSPPAVAVDAISTGLQVDAILYFKSGFLTLPIHYSHDIKLKGNFLRQKLSLIAVA